MKLDSIPNFIEIHLQGNYNLNSFIKINDENSLIIQNQNIFPQDYFPLFMMNNQSQWNESQQLKD